MVVNSISGNEKLSVTQMDALDMVPAPKSFPVHTGQSAVRKEDMTSVGLKGQSPAIGGY